MEQIEIHSKSYLVRWIHVSPVYTISWTVQPHRKSINVALFRHSGAKTSSGTALPIAGTDDAPSLVQSADGRAKTKTPNDNSTVVETLQSKGMKLVLWGGKCDADKVTTGSYDVAEGDAGMYGLVFDNTFSKTLSKTATVVIMTHPSYAPPKIGSTLQFSQADASSTSLPHSRRSPSLHPVPDSQESLPTDVSSHRVTFAPPGSRHGSESHGSGPSFYTGILQKKRRKRKQGFARRYFSLDFTTSTLSYYHHRNSSALRGAIPLSLAAVSVDAKSRAITVDSGAEVWHLRANNAKDFEGWKRALEKASDIASARNTEAKDENVAPTRPLRVDPEEEKEWDQVESLVGKIAGIRDAVRRLAQNTDPKYLPRLSIAPGQGISEVSDTPSPSESENGEYFAKTDQRDRKAFWKRKPSTPGPANSLFKRSVSSQLVVPSSSGATAVNGHFPRPQSANPSERDVGIHGHCMALLTDLDDTVIKFSELLSESRQRRQERMRTTLSRQSTDSLSSEEFFDAPDGESSRSQVLNIDRDSEESEEVSQLSDGASETSSEFASLATFQRKSVTPGELSIYPSRPKSLAPLPLDPVQRRTSVPTVTFSPPSLISFLRKNVGKDLSTIAMPVSANEPTSALQRTAEQMEYSELIDAAATKPGDTGERILYVAAFAISSLALFRVKERAIRKPFNPMLGETFELVREDKGYRFLAEKVSHHPVRMAYQAESANWTVTQAPMPVQKFWGKSVEINMNGSVHVFIHSVDEHYSWTTPTSFLRNIIAGDKYIEPVNTMTIFNETTGAKAVATFKTGGMFSGRSEDVSVTAYDSSGDPLPLGLQGKWTSHLNLSSRSSDTGEVVWRVGKLVDHAPQRYGFTTFAASLNEITRVERDALPPTDSRLRPDQQALEEGDLDRAEALKARLEERQRARRRVMEAHGEKWTPRWFVKVSEETGDGEEIWKMKTGKDGYWEERERGTWTGVREVFE